MFGIIKDITKETVETVKTIDKKVTNIYHEAKETAEELGIGPKSIRDIIKGK